MNGTVQSVVSTICFLLAFGQTVAAEKRVVVYCAHDQEFADEILKEFEHRTGIKVETIYDTEANKAVSLYEDLVREKSHPRCDVHWNNEILASIRLQNQGIYDAYDSPAALPYPARFKASDHTWTAFAARARVVLVNTRKVKESDRPKSLKDILDPKWHDQVVMAKPQFGTTATFAACLFETWGEAAAEDFFKKLHENKVRILPGNKNVAVAVGNGEYAIGLTDTDDAMAEVDAGHPVALVFPDRDTLFIPNTVAIVKNCPNPDGARKMIDYLLGPEVEKKLAEGQSRQIPLNPQVKAAVPREMQAALMVTPMEVDFAKAADNWDQSQRSLVKILNQPSESAGVGVALLVFFIADAVVVLIVLLVWARRRN